MSGCVIRGCNVYPGIVLIMKQVNVTGIGKLCGIIGNADGNPRRGSCGRANVVVNGWAPKVKTNRRSWAAAARGHGGFTCTRDAGEAHSCRIAEENCHRTPRRSIERKDLSDKGVRDSLQI